MYKKRGINLIALTITMIVLSILATVIVVNTRNSAETANKVAFTEELKNILDACNVYYLENGHYPISITYNEHEFLNLTNSNNIQALKDEMALNQETSTTFYLVDLSVISVSGGLFKDLGDDYNIYVINDNATNIYYPKGFETGKITYYSLSSKLTDMEKIPSKNEGEQIVLNNITDAINVTKDTDEWTNNLKLNINTTLNSEKLFYTIGDEEIEITETLPYELELSNITLSSEQIEILENNPKLIFFKKANDVVVAKTSIDVSNLDLKAPSLSKTPIIETGDKYNLVKLFNQNLDESGVIASFYLADTLTTNAKEIVETGVKSNPTYIKLDTSIKNIKFVLLDKAGNVSDLIEVTISE